jgi:hypothetical protein
MSSWCAFVHVCGCSAWPALQRFFRGDGIADAVRAARGSEIDMRGVSACRERGWETDIRGTAAIVFVFGGDAKKAASPAAAHGALGQRPVTLPPLLFDDGGAIDANTGAVGLSGLATVEPTRGAVAISTPAAWIASCCASSESASAATRPAQHPMLSPRDRVAGSHLQADLEDTGSLLIHRPQLYQLSSLTLDV